jgi:arylsulfatase A-like enzyme
MRNVILLCLDTVRKDYFDEHAPRLRERADLDFAQCRAASSWSVPSHASMFTGKLPHQHGIHTHNRDFSDLSREATFLGDLPEHRALGTSANVWAGSSFGFDELFDDFSDVAPDRRFPAGIDVAQFGQKCGETGLRRQAAFVRAALRDEHPLASLANGAMVQLDEWFDRLPVANPFDDGAAIIAREARSQVSVSEEPFVLFANFMDSHGPLSHVRSYDRSLHEAPLSWTSETVDWRDVLDRDDKTEISRYTGLYAAAIDYLDRQVCEFLDCVNQATDRETTVVVTSDHGDELGTDADEGRWGHVDSSLSEGLLHVPLLVLNAPDGWQDINESEYISHLSLRNLLVGLANGEVPDLTADRIAAERIGHSGSLSTVADKRGTEEDRLLRAVYDGSVKYIWDSQGNQTAYQLDPERPCWQEATATEFDSDEFVEFFDGNPADVKRHAADSNTTSDVDKATMDRLDDLGYL